MKEVEMVAKGAEKGTSFFAKHKKLCIGGAVAAGAATLIGVAAKVLHKEPEYYECGTSDDVDSPVDVSTEE